MIIKRRASVLKSQAFDDSHARDLEKHYDEDDVGKVKELMLCVKKLVTRKPAKKRDNTLLYIYKMTDTHCSASDTASFLGQADIFFVIKNFFFISMAIQFLVS